MPVSSICTIMETCIVYKSLDSIAYISNSALQELTTNHIAAFGIIIEGNFRRVQVFVSLLIGGSCYISKQFTFEFFKFQTCVVQPGAVRSLACDEDYTLNSCNQLTSTFL